MIRWIVKKLTKNYTEVPLLVVTFDLNKYNQNGAERSCDIRIHPEINDDYVDEAVKQLITHIRNNCDMNKISKYLGK